MRIEVKGRNLPVSDDLREHVAKRFRKVERQVSELAELEVEVFEERNPAIAEVQVAEATLHLKGVTLRARSASPDICTRSTCARRARGPGQAPSRQAPQAPRAARRRRRGHRDAAGDRRWSRRSRTAAARREMDWPGPARAARSVRPRTALEARDGPTGAGYGPLLR